MRFISVPELESFEARILPQFGQHHLPHGPVSVGDDTVMRAPGLEFVDLDGQTLALHPDTASWAFVNAREYQFLNDLRGLRARNVAWLREHWPSARGAELEHFIALL